MVRTEELKSESRGESTGPLGPRLRARDVLAELRPTLALAGPVVFAELGWMAMGVVDTVMVGRLGPEALGAVGLGNSLHLAVTIFGIGLLLGLDSVISQAFGRGDLADCHRSMIQGVYLALAVSPVLMAIVWLAIPAMQWWGIDPKVLALAAPFTDALNWSTPPLLVFFALRRYVQGMNQVRVVMMALVFANLVNVLGNYILIFGRFGLPSFGVTGSGWSTCLARVSMMLVLVVHAVRVDRKLGTGLWKVSFRPDFARLKQLVKLGLPAAGHLVLECGVFATVTALAARFSVIALAAHQIVLETAGVTFMVPLGVSSAAAVRVGQALGRGEPAKAAAAGWAALIVGEGFMALSAISFWTIPRTLLGLFSNDGEVVAAGVVLLAIAAGFQMFDGLQVMTTGILRGTGDTHAPMFVNLVAYWVIGLPLGTTLAFHFNQGVPGLWIGLFVGLMAAGAVLLAIWAHRARALVNTAERGTEEILSSEST